VERELLLLGLLRAHAMYGYQLNEMIDNHLGVSVKLTKPTAYRLLDEMESSGWVTSREEREGNRPPRFIYTITPAGEETFQRLLRESLADYKTSASRSDISIAFIDVLPRAEALSLLGKRRALIADLANRYRPEDGHHGSFGLVVEHRLRLLATELDWLDEVIQRVEETP
jgi:DNA-binding PadR family transcriptional regulator